MLIYIIQPFYGENGNMYALQPGVSRPGVQLIDVEMFISFLHVFIYLVNISLTSDFFETVFSSLSTGM